MTPLHLAVATVKFSLDSSDDVSPGKTILCLHELLELDETSCEVSDEFHEGAIEWSALHDLHAAAWTPSDMIPIWSKHTWLFGLLSASGSSDHASNDFCNVQVQHGIPACARPVSSDDNDLGVPDVSSIAFCISDVGSLQWAYDFMSVSDCIPSRCFGIHHNEDSKARRLKTVLVQCESILPDDTSLTDILFDGLNEFYGFDEDVRLEGWISNDGHQLCIVCDQDSDHESYPSESEQC